MRETPSIKIPGSIFAPSKLAYIGFVVLLATDSFSDDLTIYGFLQVTLGFIVVSAFEVHFFRKLLNKWADRINKRIAKLDKKDKD